MKIKKYSSLKSQKARAGVVFSLPFIVGFLLIFIPAMFNVFSFSLNDIKVMLGGNGYKLNFTGLSYYKQALFEDSKFNRMLLETLSKMLVQTPIILIFSLFAATLLNQQFRGRTAARLIFFIPVIVSTGIIAYVDNNWISVMTVSGIDNVLSGSQNVSLEALFSNIEFGQSLVTVVITAAEQLNKIIRSSGMQIYIFLAAFQEISPSLYEAAKVEGCSAWECFWKISIPMVTPQIIICSVYTLIDIYTATDTEIYSYINNFAFVNNQQSLASAMNVLYLLAVGIVILVGAGILKLNGRKREPNG